MLQVPNGMRNPMMPHPVQRPYPVQNPARGRFVPRGVSQSTTGSSAPELLRPPRGPPPAKHFRPPQTADSFASIDSRFSQSTGASGVPTILRAPRGPPRMMSEQLPATPEGDSESRVVSEMSERGSPSSAGFPEIVYVPRIRPMHQFNPETPISEAGEIDAVSTDGHVMPATPSPHESVQIDQEVSRFSDDQRSSAQDPVWREQSVYLEDKGMFGIVNRQIALFCVGFFFPLGECHFFDIYYRNALTSHSLVPGSSPPHPRKTGNADDWSRRLFRQLPCCCGSV